MTKERRHKLLEIHQRIKNLSLVVYCYQLEQNALRLQESMYLDTMAQDIKELGHEVSQLYMYIAGQSLLKSTQ